MPSHPERVRRNQPEVNEAIPNKVKGLPYQCLKRCKACGHGYPMMWRDAYDAEGFEITWCPRCPVSEPAPDRRACPRCAGPSLSGGICLACLRGPDEPTTETPWAV